jgi:hypothetical protein
MEEILWHRRESRRKTEKTNIFLQPWEAPAYSKKWVPYFLVLQQCENRLFQITNKQITINA